MTKNKAKTKMWILSDFSVVGRGTKVRIISYKLKADFLQCLLPLWSYSANGFYLAQQVPSPTAIHTVVYDTKIYRVNQNNL